MDKPIVLQTKTYELLRERMDEAYDEGVNAIVYGPPSSEKSFVLAHLREEFAAEGKPVIYLYCGPRTTESFLYRGLAQAAGVRVDSTLRWACRYALLNNLQRSQKLPVIVLDEAQHLDIDALEGVRQLHDLTARDDRRGCGVILAGSHNLLREFLSPMRRPRLEQMLSRFPHRVQLEGMQREEILSLAARAFGNGKPAKLTAQQEKVLLERCTVDDPYHIGADGKGAPRQYFSSRRLLEYVRQQKQRGARKRSTAHAA